jgi:hypothetical protein
MVNLFSILALVLVVAVRWVAPDRSYTEACLVTYVLVVLDVLLKLADATLPITLTTSCFPESLVPPFNSSLIARNWCGVGVARTRPS